MKMGANQPYFLPYIGYWQLINAVDKFVLADILQFNKEGWIHRNRILRDGKDVLFTIPLKSDSSFVDISEKFISDQYFDKDADRLLRKIENSYHKAPHFEEAMPIIKKCFLYNEKNLFKFILNSVQLICGYIGITTEIMILSNLYMDHSLKLQDRAIEICKTLNATLYVNSIGGLELYDGKSFGLNGIELKFIKSKTSEYKQFNNEFVPSLSIIDVMMFNSKDDIKRMLNMYELIVKQEMSEELSLEYFELDRNEPSLKEIENYFNNMCYHFIPPINQLVDINTYSNKLVQNADCFFIKNRGKNIGFLAIYTNDHSGKIAFISSISIIPEYQGTGISQKLMDFSIKHAREKGMKYLRLEVSKNNIRAMKYYEKNIFNIESTDNNSLIMIKSI
jgi:ribosomal protein S18 acetylase RimI-like enzyme